MESDGPGLDVLGHVGVPAQVGRVETVRIAIVEAIMRIGIELPFVRSCPGKVTTDIAGPGPRVGGAVERIVGTAVARSAAQTGRQVFAAVGEGQGRSEVERMGEAFAEPAAAFVEIAAVAVAPELFHE